LLDARGYVGPEGLVCIDVLIEWQEVVRGRELTDVRCLHRDDVRARGGRSEQEGGLLLLLEVLGADWDRLHGRTRGLLLEFLDYPAPPHVGQVLRVELVRLRVNDADRAGQVPALGTRGKRLAGEDRQRNDNRS